MPAGWHRSVAPAHGQSGPPRLDVDQLEAHQLEERKRLEEFAQPLALGIRRLRKSLVWVLP